MSENIQVIEDIAEQLVELDSDKKDRTITSREFNNISNGENPTKNFKVLTGEVGAGENSEYMKQLMENKFM